MATDQREFSESIPRASRHSHPFPSCPTHPEIVTSLPPLHSSADLSFRLVVARVPIACLAFTDASQLPPPSASRQHRSRGERERERDRAEKLRGAGPTGGNIIPPSPAA